MSDEQLLREILKATKDGTTATETLYDGLSSLESRLADILAELQHMSSQLENIAIK